MSINGIYYPTFGYKSILKTLFNEGKLPSVKVDIYGKPLQIGEATIEHMIPKSRGGKSNLANYTLANIEDNMRRGNDINILKYTTVENVKNWYNQFTDVVLPNFDGNEYKKNAKPILKKLDIYI